MYKISLFLFLAFDPKDKEFISVPWWWRSWMMHCTASRKVADSIPGGISGIFHCYNLWDRLSL
jgi:hypothetical protein